jgi:LPS-assembly protein
MLPSYAAASYSCTTDTGVDALDYIENRHRAERENRLTADEKQLMQDTQVMQKHLRHPVDPKKAVPTSFEGDDLTWDQQTGEFVAQGKVQITQLDEHRFNADKVTGNTIKQEIDVADKAHMLQLTPGMSKVRLDGYRTHYNYGAKTGSMEEASGKTGNQYVTGQRFDFYPDHIEITHGTATKCGAKKPDYHLAADKIVIWPNDKMIMTNVRFYLGKYILYTKGKYVADLRPGAKGPDYPRVGYDSDDGTWISQDMTKELRKNVSLTGSIYYSTKQHFKPYAELRWGNAGSTYRVQYGNYNDSDDHWIKKMPSFIYDYGNHFHSLPLSYSFEYEVGRWENTDGVRSTHRYYDISLARDPISLGRNWNLYLGAGYSITQESYNDSDVRGLSYDMTTVKEFNDAFAMFAGYHYAKTNSRNSLFNYNVDDYSKKFETGFSWRFTPLDRIVVGVNYDVDAKNVADVDYYWYHDIHCAQMVVRYREKREIWNVKFNFVPW